MINLIEDKSNTAMLLTAMLPVYDIKGNTLIVRDEAVFNIVYNNETSGVITVECGDQLWLLQDVEECVASTFDLDECYGGNYGALEKVLWREEQADVESRADGRGRIYYTTPPSWHNSIPGPLPLEPQSAAILHAMCKKPSMLSKIISTVLGMFK